MTNGKAASRNNFVFFRNTQRRGFSANLWSFGQLTALPSAHQKNLLQASDKPTRSLSRKALFEHSLFEHPLSEQPRIHLVIETDDHLLPHHQSRRAEVSGWAKHHFQYFFVRCVGFFAVDLHDLFAFGGVDGSRRRNQLERFGFLMDVLFRIDNHFGFDAFLRKKLLRFRASLSALAVVIPINFLSHGSFLLILIVDGSVSDRPLKQSPAATSNLRSNQTISSFGFFH